MSTEPDAFTRMTKSVDRALELIDEMQADIDRLQKLLKLEYTRGFEEGFRASTEAHDKSMEMIEKALGNR